MSARIWQQQRVRIFPHTSTSGEVWDPIKKCTTTSQDGGAPTTTVIDTKSDSGSANLYNGAYWIHILSGACIGEKRRIVEDDGAGTYIVERAFSGSIASGVEFEILKSPEPVFVADGGTVSTTQINHDARNEDDDFWIGYYLCCIRGVNAGFNRRITAWDKAGGASEGLLTTDAFPAAHLQGDVFLVGKFIEVELAPSLDEVFNQRPGIRDDLAAGDGTRGPRSGALPFTSDIYPSGSLAAAGSKANPSVHDAMLRACGFDEQIDTSGTVAAGSSTSVIKVTAGHHERFTIGNAVVWNGNVAWVTDKDDNGGSADDVTVSPPFPNIPQAADVLYATRGYRKATSGDVIGCGFELEIDSCRWTMTGCKGNVTYDHSRPQLSWNFQVDEWIGEYAPALYGTVAAAYPTVSPLVAHDSKVYVDTTRTGVLGLTASLDAQVQPRPVAGNYSVNGREGFQITSHGGPGGGGTFRELLDSDGTTLPQQLRYLHRTAFSLAVVCGSHGHAGGLRVPVARLIKHGMPMNESGLLAGPNVFQAQDAGTVFFDTSSGAEDASTKMPDFMFFLT